MKNLIEKSYPIIRIEESGEQKLFFFELEAPKIHAGQFYMIRYNNSQKPFSVSHINGNEIGFTIAPRGKMTHDIIENARLGDYIGLTGPLGNGFNFSACEQPLLIGGGVGSAPIFALANQLFHTKKKATILLGARTDSLHTYTKSLKNLENYEVQWFTDDASSSRQGFVTEGIENAIAQSKPDAAFICGPEKMMVKASEIIHSIDPSIDIQISMERYMKCGIGICGSCTLDDIGLRVCADGPVFTYEN